MTGERYALLMDRLALDEMAPESAQIVTELSISLAVRLDAEEAVASNLARLEDPVPYGRKPATVVRVDGRAWIFSRNDAGAFWFDHATWKTVPDAVLRPTLVAAVKGGAEVTEEAVYEEEAADRSDVEGVGE